MRRWIRPSAHVALLLIAHVACGDDGPGSDTGAGGAGSASTASSGVGGTGATSAASTSTGGAGQGGDAVGGHGGAGGAGGSGGSGAAGGAGGGGGGDPDAGPIGSGETVEMRVGPDGGSVSLGAATLEVPPGALGDDVVLSITELAVGAGTDALLPIIALEPAGTQFATPVRVTFTLPEEPDAPPIVYWTGEGAEPELVEPTVDGAQLTVENDHFSSLTVSYQRCGNGATENATFVCKRTQVISGLRTCVDLVRLAAETCDDGNATTETCPHGGVSPCQVCNAQCALVESPAVFCGDGVQNGPESCDDGNAVTEACAYGEACTVCTAACTLGPGVETSCGDGEVDPSEACDDGNTVAEVCDYGQPSCTVCAGDCQWADGATSSCSDGVRNGPEECDDGDLDLETCPYGTTCPVCGPACTIVAGIEIRCGNGAIDGPEDCDDGNADTEACAYGTSCTVCTASCSEGAGVESRCGDYVVNGPEVCDDGNTIDDDCEYGEASCVTCGADCTWTAGIVVGQCGDGVVNGPEPCDGLDLDGRDCATLGYLSGTLACDPSCQLDDGGCSDIAEPRPIVGGPDHFCAIEADGRIACWGGNGYRQAMPPGGAFTDVAVSTLGGCGIRDDGTLACWGHASLTAAVPAGTFEKVAVGGSAGASGHACAIAVGGALACWGNDLYGQATPPAGTFRDVAAGGSSTCALRTDGTATCWGNNTAQLAPPGIFVSVVHQNGTVCLLDAAGAVRCSGTTFPGQAPPPAGTLFEQIAIGTGTVCGVKVDHTVDCWGAEAAYLESMIEGTFVQVAHFNNILCGQRTDDTVVCFGNGNDLSKTRELGPRVLVDGIAMGGRYSSVSTACRTGLDQLPHCWGVFDHADQPPAEALASFDVGTTLSCGVTPGGELRCWGRTSGVPVPGGGGFAEVRVADRGVVAACARRSDGTFTCFDADSNPVVPQGLPGDGGYLAVDVSPPGVCAIDAAGALTCWWRSEPPPIPPPATGSFTALAMTLDRGCAIDDTGEAVCWGNLAAPPPSPPGPFAAIDVSETHACALRDDGTAACWALGPQTGPHVDAPDGTFTQVAAGTYDSCGRRPDGRLTCWGSIARMP